jgi:hemolysin III
VTHTWAFILSMPLGAALVVAAGDARARVAVSIYALSLMALFGISALYHRAEWRSLTAYQWMRRLDHSMIFVMIAGTYTPFALLAVHGPLALAILLAVWTGAAGGIVVNLLWPAAPARLRASLYVLLGWISVVALPQLAGTIGAGGIALVAAGGVLYTAGAVIYARKRPDPAPAVFGYHEIFHVLVTLAAALQFAVIAFWVLPE